jgi:hypothetical protein
VRTRRSRPRRRRPLGSFVAEVNHAPQPKAQADRDVLVDDAMERYLEHLAEDKGAGGRDDPRLPVGAREVVRATDRQAACA